MCLLHVLITGHFNMRPQFANVKTLYDKISHRLADAVLNLSNSVEIETPVYAYLALIFFVLMCEEY